MTKVFFKVVKWGLCLSIFSFLAWRIYIDWEKLGDEVIIKVNYYYLVSAFIILMFLSFFQTYIWKVMIESLSCRISYLKAFRIFTLSNLGRYVPGKIWQFFGAAYLSEKENICGIKAGLVTATNFMISVLSGGVFSLFLLYQNPFVRERLDLKVAIFSLILLLSLLHPYSMDKITKLIKKITGRQLEIASFSFLSMVRFFLLFLLLWVIYGVAFILFVQSFYNINFIEDFSIAGVYPLSFILGYMVLFAPAGLGVREGILTYLLTYYMPLPIAGIIAIMSRLWLTSVELFSVAIALRVK